MDGQRNLTAEDRALKRAKETTDVMWHVSVYAIVNIFLWFIDIAQGGGLDWAFWPTIGWGIAVAFHVASHVIDDSGRFSAIRSAAVRTFPRSPTLPAVIVRSCGPSP